MEISKYLDSTYLKLPGQAGISAEETLEKVIQLADEAHEHQIFAVMIRPEYVKQVKHHLEGRDSEVKVGTVIGFHEGTASTAEKMAEAKKAIEDGADELDFVLNFEAFKKGEVDLVEKEVVACTTICLEHGKIAKWIIETAALSAEQIADITQKISGWISARFPGQEEMVFVKSSTGFYQTEDGKPNGATFESIKIMLHNAGKLPVKASGGVRTPGDAKQMIELGVKRIGTSAALALIRDAF